MLKHGTYSPKSIYTLPVPIRDNFTISPSQELLGLVENVTLRVIRLTDVPTGQRIFGSCRYLHLMTSSLRRTTT